jgi:hypothetical protein
MGASRAKRKMAEDGLIWRDGHYVSKEEWYKAHPTAEMKKETRKVVKSAVQDEMKRILAKKNLPSPEQFIEEVET